MNRQQYMAARALLRANGRAALRWMQPHHAAVMRRLEEQRDDPLEALAYDQPRMALRVNVWLLWRRAAWLER